MITLANYGNIDLLSAPRPAGAESFGKPNAIHVSYLLPTDVTTTAADCRRVLAARGWHESASFNEPPPLPGPSRSMRFMKNAVVFYVLITKAPENLGKATLLDFSAQAVEPFDMPVAADAVALKVDPRGCKVQYQSAHDVVRIAEFYAAAGAGLGWTRKPADKDHPGSLVFEDGAGSLMVVRASSLPTGGTRVETWSISREQRQLASASRPAVAKPVEAPKKSKPRTVRKRKPPTYSQRASSA